MPSRPRQRYCGVVPVEGAGVVGVTGATGVAGVAAVVVRGRGRTGRRGRRTGRRTGGVGGGVVWLTTPVWLVSGELTADPSGRLLTGCGAWFCPFELLETGGASENFEQAASEAASSTADIMLKRDIIVIFLEMEAVRLLERRQSCRDCKPLQPSICGHRGSTSTGGAFAQQGVPSIAGASRTRVLLSGHTLLRRYECPPAMDQAATNGVGGFLLHPARHVPGWQMAVPTPVPDTSPAAPAMAARSRQRRRSARIPPPPHLCVHPPCCPSRPPRPT